MTQPESRLFGHERRRTLPTRPRPPVWKWALPALALVGAGWWAADWVKRPHDLPVQAQATQRTVAQDWRTLRAFGPRDPGSAAARRLSAILPPDIVVRTVGPAPAGFDARFSAVWRRYRYRICDDPAAADPLRRGDTVHLADRLDADRMHAAAQELLGLNDFAAFCKRREGASTVRTLLDYGWRRDGDGILVAQVQADAFCHSMVRALVGALIPVGLGRAEVGFPAQVLRAGVRDPRVKVMPAHGLSLEEVRYPAQDGLAARAEQARARREPLTAQAASGAG